MGKGRGIKGGGREIGGEIWAVLSIGVCLEVSTSVVFICFLESIFPCFCFVAFLIGTGGTRFAFPSCLWGRMVKTSAVYRHEPSQVTHELGSRPAAAIRLRRLRHVWQHLFIGSPHFHLFHKMKRGFMGLLRFAFSLIRKMLSFIYSFLNKTMLK